MKSFAAGEACGSSQIFFDAQQLIVLCGPISARQRSGFDLPGVSTHGEVGNEWIFSFTGTMRNDRRSAVSLRELNTVQRLG
jgi:hypothetical protein